jgi:hypothetical protein
MTNIILAAALFTNYIVTEVTFENYGRITVVTNTVIGGYYSSPNTTNKQVWEQWQTNVVYKTNILSIVPLTNKQTNNELK